MSLLPCSGRERPIRSSFALVALDAHSLSQVVLALQMMGGDKTRAKPRIDIAIPMALVSKSVTSELNRPGAKAETLHG